MKKKLENRISILEARAEELLKTKKEVPKTAHGLMDVAREARVQNLEKEFNDILNTAYIQATWGSLSYSKCLRSDSFDPEEIARRFKALGFEVKYSTLQGIYGYNFILDWSKA